MLSFLATLFGTLLGFVAELIMGPWSVPFLLVLLIYLLILRRRRN